MNRRIAAVGIALCLILAVAATYICSFGIRQSNNQDVWGQFGDYFGGVLNPIFGLLAFLGLL